MIGVIWRTPRQDRDDKLFERFKSTPGIVATYRLGNDDEVVVLTIWESAKAREAYMASALQTEVSSANPRASRIVYEVLDSVT